MFPEHWIATTNLHMPRTAAKSCSYVDIRCSFVAKKECVKELRKWLHPHLFWFLYNKFVLGFQSQEELDRLTVDETLNDVERAVYILR